MAISGELIIAVGLQNESANSDSLYTAFNKTKDNFATLFAQASPYSNFANGIGITANSDANTNTLTITNTGVVSLTSTDGSIGLSGANGNIIISSANVSNLATSGTFCTTGVDTITNGGAANLQVTPSVFSTTGSWTGTVAAGLPGQIKTFVMLVSGGNMVLTVTNAGWKSSGTGTITFANIGDACTLQYISSKWFSIGTNGVTFA
jgi:hypothetical protein